MTFNMAYRKARLLAILASIATIAIGFAGAVVMIFWPLDIEVPQSAPSRGVLTKRAIAKTQPTTLEDFADSLSKPLQRPLTDPAPPQPNAAPIAELATPPTTIEVALIGTAIDSDASRSMAWLQMPGKPAILVQVGDQVKAIPGEPIVDKVSVGTATLRYTDRVIALELKRHISQP